ncbi:MAG: hypothetical protein LAO76_10375 [Acidobacteriia bacterium]|nr:hypothetical protein [Terriglobia bacterium]
MCKGITALRSVLFYTATLNTVCSNQAMDTKTQNPQMWINPKSNFTGGAHAAEYGEGQSTHNSRFLELADVVLSKDKPAKAKAAAAGQDSKK